MYQKTELIPTKMWWLLIGHYLQTSLGLCHHIGYLLIEDQFLFLLLHVSYS